MSMCLLYSKAEGNTAVLDPTCLSAMAASSSIGNTGTSLSKWQIALLVGAPVAVGLGIWYLKQTGTSTDLDKEKHSREFKNKAVGGQNSLDKEGEELQIEMDSAEKSPIKQALAHKSRGNQHFKARRYDDAIKCYNEAIEVCPKDKKLDLATFYQNRAAAHEQMKMYEEVQKDCTMALELNPKYVKALQRRAKACELTKNLQQSLEDITAACILEAFQNQTTLLTADRVLKELGKQHAKEAMTKRKPIMPSKQFIKTYFSSFIEDPVWNFFSECINENKDTLNFSGFLRAREAFKSQDYDAVIPACTEEIEANGPHKMEAYLLRATFNLLLGDHDTAMKQLEDIITSENIDVKLRVNALIKRASLYMQMEKPDLSLEDFKAAAELDPNNSDIFHHRGQVHLLMEKVPEAMADFEKAVALSPNFAIACVQKCYTDYRYAYQTCNREKREEVLGDFQRAIDRFPNCSECYTLYAQVLTDQQEFEKADGYFKKAIEVEPENATVYVHRGLLHLQWTGDIQNATDLIKQALKIDDRCEFGYETLGTIEVQRGNLRHAVELFDKAIPLAKTELEMSHLFSLRDAAIAQATVADKMGIRIPNIENS